MNLNPRPGTLLEVRRGRRRRYIRVHVVRAGYVYGARFCRLGRGDLAELVRWPLDVWRRQCGAEDVRLLDEEVSA